MRSRNTWLFISAALILLIALLLALRPFASLQNESKRLVLKNEEGIDRIWIRNAYDSTYLQRSADSWQVNGQDAVNMVAVENLLYAASHYQVSTIMSSLPEGSSWEKGRISFQQGEKPVLVLDFYTAQGRFLVRTGRSERYYEMQLPGRHQVELREVFSCHAGPYMEHMLISLLPSEITYLEVQRKGEVAFRFSMDREGNFSCLLPEQDSLVPPDLLDETAIRLLFSYFTTIRYEYPLAEWKGGDRFTLEEEERMARLSLLSGEGDLHRLELWPLPGEKPGEAHMFLAAVRHNDRPDILVVKYIHLDVLMRPLPAYYVNKR